MSGKRQHVIPRFLLRRFASKAIRQEALVWVFRGDAQPFEANIKKIAVEKHFYTEGENTKVDDSITGAEGRFASLVAELVFSPSDPSFLRGLLRVPLSISLEDLTPKKTEFSGRESESTLIF